MTFVEIAVPMGWLAGTVMSIRPMMRRTMLKEVCEECDGVWSCDHPRAGYHRTRNVVRGSAFPRTGFHVFTSLWNASWWPLWIVGVVGWTALKSAGTGLKLMVDGVTPLTEPELDRLIRERAKDIQELTREIHGGVVVVPSEPSCKWCKHASDAHYALTGICRDCITITGTQVVTGKSGLSFSCGFPSDAGLPE